MFMFLQNHLIINNNRYNKWGFIMDFLYNIDFWMTMFMMMVMISVAFLCYVEENANVCFRKKND